MTPLVSPLFHGPVLTEHTDLVPGEGVLGRPVWGPGALLGNLEMRLGLPRSEMDDAVRVQHWSRRLATLDASRPRFYSKSYVVDPLGTAKTLLEWRDALVLAGWTGEPVANGGERLDALVELEASASATELGSGFADAGRSGSIDVASGALRRVRAFREALSQETRRALTLNEVRQLLEEAVGPGHQLSLNVESAGRMDHVSHPAGLRGQRDVVLWWHCVAGAERRPRPLPWRRSELAARGWRKLCRGGR